MDGLREWGGGVTGRWPLRGDRRHTIPHDYHPAVSAPSRQLSGSLSRAGRAVALWAEQARAALGIRRGVHAPEGGVYYKELSAEPLARALSSTADGVKK